MKGYNDDFFGIYCNEAEDAETMKIILNCLYKNKKSIEFLFNNGSISSISKDGFWIKINYNKSKYPVIEYFANFDELMDSYKYVRNIFLYENSGKWIINPTSKNEREKTYIDNIMDFFIDTVYYFIK